MYISLLKEQSSSLDSCLQFFSCQFYYQKNIILNLIVIYVFSTHYFRIKILKRNSYSNPQVWQSLLQNRMSELLCRGIFTFTSSIMKMWIFAETILYDIILHYLHYCLTCEWKFFKRNDINMFHLESLILSLNCFGVIFSAQKLFT